MQQISMLSAVVYLLLLPPAAAFYLYIPTGWGQAKTLKAYQKSYTRSEGHSIATPAKSITLPLRRTPSLRRPLVLRDNDYDITSAPVPTQTNSVGIDQDGTDFTYMSTMKFGTSDTEYHMLIDTAAANTWVMSSECKTDVCDFHNTLGSGVSSSLKTTQDTFTVTYGTGNVNGTIASDDAHFAGFTVPLTFGLASGVSEQFASYPLDGIIGLGRLDADSNRGTNAPSIIDVLSESNLIEAKLFGVHLGRHASPPIDGELNIGAPNPDRYDGDLHYIPVVDNERGFWEIPIEDSGVDGTSTGIKDRFAIVDTGTSFILIPPTDAAKLHSLIPGSQLNGDAYTIPCDTTSVVQFTFGGTTYDISPLDFVGSDNGNGACNSQIIARQTFDDDQWLVGDVFLRNVYTVFDYDQSRIGFGTKGQAHEQNGDAASPSPSVGDGAPATTSVSPPASSTSSVSEQNNAEPSTLTGAAALSRGAPSRSLLALGIALGMALFWRC